MRTLLIAATITASALAFGCDDISILDPDEGRGPAGFEGQYQWVLHGWEGAQPVGQPSVVLTWDLPADWRGEVFRVYARPSNQSGYSLAATVTSCGSDLCRYTDLNVVSGRSYDYYIATLDERSGRELATSSRVQVRVPAFAAAAAPEAPTVVALDNALYVRWRSTGAERYRVLAESADGRQLFDVGETDGTGFLDLRAQNGTISRYRVAAFDTLGHPSRLTDAVAGIPRPDYQAELIWAHQDSAQASGFRFVERDADDPIMGGASPQAQWRVERTSAGLVLQPLGATRVTQGIFTTALACGPASEPDCLAIVRAPPVGEFRATPVLLEAGNTYILMVQGADARTRYGKIRVQGEARDRGGRAVVIFDWAYQLRADEPSLVKD